MPSTQAIRRRIRSTKNIAQITKAMQMVASSRMRRAQERVQQSRPYSEHLRDLVSHLANAGSDDVGDEVALLQQRPVRNIAFLILSPDRGLSGALPSNINRKAATTALEQQNTLAENGQRPNIHYIAVGRKARDFIVRTEQHLVAEFTNIGNQPSMNDATAIAQVAMDTFLKEEADVVYMVYPKFVNTVTQQPTAVQLLPIQPPEQKEDERTNIDYIYEPSANEIYKALLPRYVDIQVYQAMLELVASQLSAQMVSMKNATDNANELVQDLNLTYNKARQSAITTQILEVVSGAEAL
ncbi:MAG TPA: ATP synthase F1 subunit gamma [Ktedonobacteraceae bacterium]|jgi:F-type H+-transporting ATPase subunit gamma